MRKYSIKRVTLDNVGFQYNVKRGMWEMWDNGKKYGSVAISTASLIDNFINYNFQEV